MRSKRLAQTTKKLAYEGWSNPLGGCTQLHGIRAAAVTQEVAFSSSAGILQSFGLQKQQARCGSSPFFFFFS